jgi:hypothetical protein
VVVHFEFDFLYIDFFRKAFMRPNRGGPQKAFAFSKNGIPQNI